MKYYFYKIVNRANNKCYIGMTKRDIMLRFGEHIRYSVNNHDINNDYFMPIYNAIRKYGPDSFEIYEMCRGDFETHKDAEIMEGRLIVENTSLLSQHGYNLNIMNENGTRTYEKEVMIKLIRNNTGSNNPFFNKKHTEKTKKILSLKAKKRFSDPKKNPRYGYKYTEEDKEKQRMSHKKFGRPFYAEGIFYQTLGEAAVLYNLTKQAIKNRLDSQKYKDWFYS